MVVSRTVSEARIQFERPSAGQSEQLKLRRKTFLRLRRATKFGRLL
jgi:hypothetical protein